MASNCDDLLLKSLLKTGKCVILIFPFSCEHGVSSFSERKLGLAFNPNSESQPPQTFKMFCLISTLHQVADPAAHSHGKPSVTPARAIPVILNWSSQSSGRFRSSRDCSYGHCPLGYVPAGLHHTTKVDTAAKAKVLLKSGSYRGHCQTSAQQQQQQQMM